MKALAKRTILFPLSSFRRSTSYLSVLFAQNARNLNIPVAFTSYQANSSVHETCLIWQAGLATSASPDLFEPVEIERGQSYIGASLGANNPSKVVIEEVAKIFPGRKIAAFVSVGSGHPKTISLTTSSIHQVTLNIARDCEVVHQDMVSKFTNHLSLYHRFNVEQGLQVDEEERLTDSGSITAHTHQYLLDRGVKQRLQSAAKVLVQAEGRVGPEQLSMSLIRHISHADERQLRQHQLEKQTVFSSDHLHQLKSSLGVERSSQRWNNPYVRILHSRNRSGLSFTGSAVLVRLRLRLNSSSDMAPSE